MEDAVKTAVMAERKRCAEIALRWMREADTMLGFVWRASRDIALAEVVAEGIADEIISTTEDKSDE